MSDTETLKLAWILTTYSEWLEEHGYLDSDWRDEAPNAVNRFMEEA